MKVDRKKRQLLILGGLLVVLGFTLFRMVFPSNETPGGIPSSQATKSVGVLDLKDIYLKRNPKKSGGRKETSFQEIDPTIHLDWLENFDPGTPLNARNMFSQEAAAPEQSVAESRPRGRRNAAPPVSAGPGTPSASNPVPGYSRPPTIPVSINLKFYGTAFDPMKKKRQGFFAEGETVFFASEGDLLASRYRILKIGESSAEIEDVSSKLRRQINLTTQ
ncbi:MAG: hypothetical protein U0V70_03340 [Terriglobia bacterium]